MSIVANQQELLKSLRAKADEVKDLRTQLAKANERVKELEWEMEAMQGLFANENDDCLVAPFNSENLFKWLNNNDIEKKIEALDDIRCRWLAKASEMSLGLECRSKGASCYNWAMYYAQELAHEIEQLRKEQD